MHTVELLEMALELATRQGYRIRQDFLGGAQGGACEIRGQKWLLLDPDTSPADQLELVLAALGSEPALAGDALPPALARVIPLRRSA